MNCASDIGHRTGAVTMSATSARPFPIAGDRVQKVVHLQRKLKIIPIEGVLFVVETEPKEGLQRFGEQVDSARVGPSRNALKDEESILFLDESFRPSLTNGKKRPQHIPSV